MIDQSGYCQVKNPEAAQPQRGLIDPALLDNLRKAIVSVTQPWWQGEFVSENGLIYGANLAGSRPPLIWCFQGYEEFASFAQALGPDQPLYGMRSGHMVVDISADIHLHLAINYAAEIRSLGLPGPLYLGGNCQGSFLIQKAAQILVAAGQPVSLLISLNPILLTPYAGRTAVLLGRHDVTNPLFRFHNADSLLRANFSNCTIDMLPSEHGKLFGGRMLPVLSDVVRRRMDEAAGAYFGGFPNWTLRAEISAPAEMAMTAGGLFDVPISLHNLSDTIWAPTRQSGVSVGNHWRHSDRSVVQWLDGDRSLDHPLSPGEAVEVTLLVRAPSEPGDYLLELDVQQAGMMWLSDNGISPALCRVRVAPPE